MIHSNVSFLLLPMLQFWRVKEFDKFCLGYCFATWIVLNCFAQKQKPVNCFATWIFYCSCFLHALQTLPCHFYLVSITTTTTTIDSSAHGEQIEFFFFSTATWQLAEIINVISEEEKLFFVLYYCIFCIFFSFASYKNKIRTNCMCKVSNTKRKIFSESCYSKLIFDCNYHFPIDLAPIGIPFGAKSIG